MSRKNPVAHFYFNNLPFSPTYMGESSWCNAPSGAPPLNLLPMQMDWMEIPDVAH